MWKHLPLLLVLLNTSCGLDGGLSVRTGPLRNGKPGIWFSDIEVDYRNDSERGRWLLVLDFLHARERTNLQARGVELRTKGEILELTVLEDSGQFRALYVPPGGRLTVHELPVTFDDPYPVVLQVVEELPLPFNREIRDELDRCRTRSRLEGSIGPWERAQTVQVFAGEVHVPLRTVTCTRIHRP